VDFKKSSPNRPRTEAEGIKSEPDILSNAGVALEKNWLTTLGMWQNSIAINGEVVNSIGVNVMQGDESIHLKESQALKKEHWSLRLN